MGSKRKLMGVLAEIFAQLEFDCAADPFCGTGAVSYLLKSLGKRVLARDSLEWCATCTRALVENNGTILGNRVDDLLEGLPREDLPAGFVELRFDELFFERQENRFIDQILDRCAVLEGYQRDLAMFALFQSCLAKRPYNLFHRANLGMRRASVARSFGNKVTWDTSFVDHITRFASQADQAVFSSPASCEVQMGLAEEADPTGVDLVYLDPPYVSGKGVGVDYLDYYHFLEGMCRLKEWEGRILDRYKHKPLRGRGRSPWCDPARIGSAFEQVIRHFADCSLVISYRSDGIPSVEEVAAFVAKAGKRVEILDLGQYTYALSRNKVSREVVILGT